MSDFSDRNPFQITTPEDLTAKETVSLFVPVFTDLPKIIDPGHVFIIGPRGIGKSMFFRYLQPDCQCLARKCQLKDLPFLGLYVPLKFANFSLTELRRLEHRHASDILGEHILSTYFAVKVFETLVKSQVYPSDDASVSALRGFYDERFTSLVSQAGADSSIPEGGADSDSIAVLEKMQMFSQDMYNAGVSFVKRIGSGSTFTPYDGPICDFSSFLLPLLSGLSQLPGLPDGPIYLLVDDAHWLPLTHTKVLNSWVATRTSRRVSFKISTQYDYKTYYTLSGATIDCPHDFSEIDISTIYTGSRKSKYLDRIADIVSKRLDTFGIKGVPAEQFFPDDEEQENAIRRIEEDYRQKHDSGEGRGHYRSDDALRYARPDFIKNLAGQRKSSSTYSYAGFKQLVHLSSGIIRSFVEPAHKMFAETVSQQPSEPITCISPSVQNAVAREYAEERLFSEMERVEKEGHEEAPPNEDIKALSNLIQGLGGLFRQILLSDRSERRVFSIAFSDEPSNKVTRILNLGVQLGYFHKSTIGRKDSKSGGRTRLYVLNRSLAPLWTLDPTGFAGYLFIQNALAEEAMNQPSSMLRRLGRYGIPDEIESVQLELF